MAMVAPATDCFLMTAQSAGLGSQVWAAACCGVRVGSLLVVETQRWSISPMRMRSPLEVTWRAGEPSANDTSMRQETAPGAGSRQRKVGAAMSGGKIDPLAG